MTVGVVTVCFSYFDHLRAWAASVAALDPKPDKVVIVTGDPAKSLAHLAGVGLGLFTLVRADAPFGFADWFNTGIAACDTDWVAWIGCDDTYRPSALAGVAESDADVVVFGMEYDHGRQWRSVPTAASILEVTSNEVPCGSPFRRSLWERQPLNVALTPYEDWALWVGLAHAGATFASTGRIDFDYRTHDDTPSALEPTRTRIAEWLTGLG